MDQSAYASDASPKAFRATPQELYNDLGKSYEEAYVNNEGQTHSLRWLVAQLPEGATVLDLGCGTGRPASKTLVEAGFEVIGVDISPVMLSHARTSVPTATFIEADLLTFTPMRSAEAVVAYYSLIGHVSQDQIRECLRKIHSFLKPGGYFIYSTVSLDGDNVMTKWMRKDFYSSSFSAANAVAEVEAAGLDVVKYEETKFVPNGGKFGWDYQVLEEPDVFVYARKNGTE